ncbi:hypothetical protein D3C81_2168870 [compost metagenome]
MKVDFPGKQGAPHDLLGNLQPVRLVEAHIMIQGQDPHLLQLQQQQAFLSRSGKGEALGP